MFSESDSLHENALIKGTMNAPVAVVVSALLLSAGAFGLDNNQNFREGYWAEIHLFFLGTRYETNLDCGIMKRKGLGAGLVAGFLGANRHQLRAWSDDHARRKIAAGAPKGCRVSSSYRLERYWWSDKHDRHIRI
jgi:hypothetical protein